MITLTFNTYSLVITLAFVIAITFAFLLLIKPHWNRKGNQYLAGLMLVIAFWNASLLLLDLDIYQYAAGVIWVPMTFTLALGPCFYFYVVHMTEEHKPHLQRQWLHFVPVVFEVLLFLLEVFQGLPEGKGYYQTQTYEFFNPIVTVFGISSFLIYSYISRRKIQFYHQWVKQNYSHYHKYNLNWLYRMSTVFLILLTVWFAYSLIDIVLFDYQLSFFDYYPFHLMLAIVSLWLCVEAFIKPEVVYSEADSKTDSISTAEKSSERPLEQQIQSDAEELKKQIETNKLYLDPDLSLRALAETLDIHPNYVSRLINEGLNQSFSDCINGYRVSAVIEKLKAEDSEGETFLAIAFECGFNSKTTFNRVFKSFTGKTPLQFKKNPI